KSTVATKATKHKTGKALARSGNESAKTATAANNTTPAITKRTINVGGDNPTHLTVKPGNGSSSPLVATSGSILNAPGAKVGDSNSGGGIASTNLSALNTA